MFFFSKKVDWDLRQNLSLSLIMASVWIGKRSSAAELTSKLKKEKRESSKSATKSQNTVGSEIECQHPEIASSLEHDIKVPTCGKLRYLRMVSESEIRQISNLALYYENDPQTSSQEIFISFYNH